ncbi:MAG TPA: hypothetical protein PK595_02025 [Bacteroidota bacterium]|jgi:hypothetical protein|nr:hypothetical protein [Bacteroidota bacterium]
MIILKYFWFLHAVLWFFIMYLAYPDISEYKLEWIKVTKDEIKKFKFRVAVAIGIPSILLQIIQLCGGYETPFYVFEEGGFNISKIGWLIVVIACYGLLLWWIWCRDGAEYLSKFLPVTSSQLKPKYIKIIITILIVVSCLAGVILAQIIR